MKRKLGISGLVSGAMLLAGSPVSGQLIPIHAEKMATRVGLGLKLDLQCSLSGFQVTVTNTLNGTIPGGTHVTISYQETVMVGGGLGGAHKEVRGTTGEWPLQSPLPHGAHFGFTAPGAYANWCSAWFYGGLPDLQLVQFTRSQNMGSVQIRNNNPFTDAGPFVLRIKAMKCSQVELGKADSNYPGWGKGATGTVTRPLPLPPGVEYFDVYVDADNAVRESNESNNGYTGVGVCIR